MAKTELEEAGLETDGMVESTAKLREEILALTDVNIMENDNTFKSTYDIMDELAAKWQDLSDIQQATVTELIAGKRQGNIVSSLMNNFDIAEQALETSLNSSGSAMAEHAKWQQSLEAQLLKVKAAWQSLSQSFLSSNFLKGTLDAVIALVNGFNSLIDTVGTLPLLLGAFTAFESFKGVGFFKTIKDEATGVATGITNIFSEAARQTSKAFQNIGLKTNSSFKASIEADIDALNRWKSELSKGPPDVGAFDRVFKNASTSAKEFAQSGKLAADGIDAFVQKQKEAQVSILAQNKSLGNARSIIREYYSGCKNVEMSQKSFADAVNQTNPQLAKQITSAKSARGAFAGYVTSLVGAKVATFALEAATMAMNAALTMGISFLITAGIKAFDKWHVSASELADKIDEVTTKYKEQYGALMRVKGDYDTSNENSMISKYGELSKGVDSLGKNVSLTAEEYSEYQSIVNTIADQIPELVSGYDSQGNAILSCAGNVDILAESYKNLIREQNKEVLDTGEDIFKDFKNDLRDSSAYHEEKVYDDQGNLVDTKRHFDTKHFDQLEEFMRLSDESLESTISKLTTDEVSRLSNLLDEYGIERDTLGSGKAGWENQREHIIRALSEDKGKVKEALGEAAEDINTYAEDLKTATGAYFSDAFLGDYAHMSEKMQNIITQATSGFDSEFFMQFLGDENPYESMTKYFDSILGAFNNLNSTDAAKFEAALDLKTQFNGGEISYGEYVNNLEDVGRLVDGLGLDEEVESQIKLSLGLNEEGFVEQYKSLVNRLSGTDDNNVRISDFDIDEGQAKDFLDGLTAEELSVATKIIPELSDNEVWETVEELQSLIDREMAIQGLTFDLNLEVEAASIESLNTALAESVSASGLSSESISALKGRYADLEAQGYDLSAMFEETSHGIHLNRQEFNKIEKAYSTQKLDDINSDLASMKSEYDKLGEAIRNCDDPLKKSELFNDRQTLAKKISEAATLAAQYEGLTSAYNDWLAAEGAGQERDMYENVISGLETIDDEISRGWYDDGTIEFLEMLSGKDLSTAGIEDLKKAYKDLDKTIEHTSYGVRDFFTKDEDGNSTSKGVYNFLDAVGQLEEEAFGGKDIVKRDGNGRIIGFDFELAGGDEAIAEALGVSEELVQIMKRAADDAGFVVSMDGTYKQLADLQNEAKAAANYLKEIGKTNFEFDFNTSNVKNLETQLEEAHSILDKFKKGGKRDGEIDLNADGATEAMQVVSALQAKLDTLTQEKYGIGLTVEDKEFEEPLENLQSYGEKVALLNQLEINPKANAEEIEKLNGELDNIAEYFANLDGDTKVKIGLDADDDIEDVKNKIADGEVKIPTTLDIQTNMDKNLSDLKDLALLNSGLLSEEQEQAIKIRLGIEVEGGEVDDSKLQEDIENVTTGDAGVSHKSGKIEAESDIEINAGEVDTSDVEEKIDGTINSEVPTGADGRKMGMGVDVEVEAGEVKTDSFWSKVKGWFEKNFSSDESGSTEVETKADVEIKAGEVDTSDVEEKVNNEVKTGAEGRLAGMGIDVNADVNVDANVNASGAKENLEEKIDKSIPSENDEEKTIIQDIKLEFRMENIIGDLGDITDIVMEANKLDDISLTIDANITGNITEANNLENLKIFAEGAKELKDAESSYVTVSANLEGNITDKNNLENLRMFAEGTKELDGAKSNNITVNANIEGNITDKKNLENLKTFAEGAKELDGAKSNYITISANVEGNVDEFENLDNLTKLAEGAKALADVDDKDISVKISGNIDGNIVELDNLDNLTGLAAVIEELDALKNKNVDVTVTANFEGSLKESENIESLAQFVQGAKDLQDVGDSSVTITANIEGDALDFTEKQLASLKVFAEGAKELVPFNDEDIKVAISANVGGEVLDYSDQQLENLKIFAKGVEALDAFNGKDIDVNVNANLTGELDAGKVGQLEDFADRAEELNALENKNVDVTITANLKGDISWSGTFADLAQFATQAQVLQNVNSSNVTVTANIEGTATSDNVATLSKFAAVVDTLPSKNVDINVKANVDADSINNAITTLQGIADSGLFKDYDATVTVDTSVTGKEQVDNLESTIDRIKSKSQINVTANMDGNALSDALTLKSTLESLNGMTAYTKTTNETINIIRTVFAFGWGDGGGATVANGTANANGTAFADGTTNKSGKAFRRGNWGTKDSGVALMGELGPETIVRDGRFFTVGDTGAGFYPYKKGDIIFNHKNLWYCLATNN